jgi:hypothetical protein
MSYKAAQFDRQSLAGGINGADVIGRDRAVGSQQRQVFAAGLRDEHAVERVAMMEGQLGDGPGMVERYR